MGRNAPTTEECLGVAFFGESSLQADMKALEWACKHLPVSNEHKLRIIHVLNNGNEARKRPGSRYDHKDLETKFSEHYPGNSVAELQTKLYEVKEYISGVTYEGENFEKALQKAIEKERLDTLVLAWWVEDDTKGPPINCTLVSERCSIILAKVHSETKLIFSMPSTQVSAATTAAAPPSSTAPALTNKRSNNKTHSTSSKAPNGRETGIATLAAQPKPSTEVSTLTTPAAASTKENNFKRTPKHSDREKAQSADQPPTSRSRKNKTK